VGCGEQWKPTGGRRWKALMLAHVRVRTVPYRLFWTWWVGAGISTQRPALWIYGAEILLDALQQPSEETSAPSGPWSSMGAAHRSRSLFLEGHPHCSLPLGTLSPVRGPSQSLKPPSPLQSQPCHKFGHWQRPCGALGMTTLSRNLQKPGEEVLLGTLKGQKCPPF
jgi:hypothetical protein